MCSSIVKYREKLELKFKYIRESLDHKPNKDKLNEMSEVSGETTMESQSMFMNGEFRRSVLIGKSEVNRIKCRSFLNRKLKLHRMKLNRMSEVSRET